MSSVTIVDNWLLCATNRCLRLIIIIARNQCRPQPRSSWLSSVIRDHSFDQCCMQPHCMRLTSVNHNHSHSLSMLSSQLYTSKKRDNGNFWVNFLFLSYSSHLEKYSNALFASRAFQRYSNLHILWWKNISKKYLWQNIISSLVMIVTVDFHHHRHSHRRSTVDGIALLISVDSPITFNLRPRLKPLRRATAVAGLLTAHRCLTTRGEEHHYGGRP